MRIFKTNFCANKQDLIKLQIDNMLILRQDNPTLT